MTKIDQSDLSQDIIYGWTAMYGFAHDINILHRELPEIIIISTFISLRVNLKNNPLL
jgi:hypothetical protein